MGGSRVVGGHIEEFGVEVGGFMVRFGVLGGVWGLFGVCGVGEERGMFLWVRFEVCAVGVLGFIGGSCRGFEGPPPPDVCCQCRE